MTVQFTPVFCSTIAGASSPLSFPSSYTTQEGGASHLLLQVVETGAYVVLLVGVYVCARPLMHVSSRCCFCTNVGVCVGGGGGRGSSQIPGSLGVSCAVLQRFHLANNTPPHSPTPLTPIRQHLQFLPAKIRSDPVNSLLIILYTLKLQLNTGSVQLI